MEVSIHAFNRIDSRVIPVKTLKQAKKLALEAYTKGYTADQLRAEFKYLARYLDFKLRGESERTEIKIYKGFVWIWNGRKKVLRTVYPIENTCRNGSDLKRLMRKELEQNESSNDNK